MRRLVLPLVLIASCADKDFVEYDSGLWDGLRREAAAQADQGRPPEIVYYSGDKMFAHSGEELVSLDPKTLDLAVIGSFGPQAPHINDLAVTPDGLLYAISSRALWRVDPKTAQVTKVADVQGTDNVALTFEASGTLLASDQPGMLRRIDPKTGALTEIGRYGPGMSAAGDLVAIKDGTLFGVNDGGAAELDNQLIKVDPKTGAASVIGAIGFAKVWGLAYWKGTVYGLTQAGLLLAIDPTTGKGTKVRTFSYEFWGAAVTPLAPID